jgi:hypothetical protein
MKCPHCGERIQIETSSRCPACHAQLPHREHHAHTHEVVRKRPDGRLFITGVVLLILAAVFAGVWTGSRRGKKPTNPKPPVAKAATPKAAPFQPVSFLKEATTMAQAVYPDAALVRIDATPVTGDGSVDLTERGSAVHFRFRSPKESSRPADVPCVVDVVVAKEGADAKAIHPESGVCDDPIIAAPWCDTRVVYQRSLDAHAPPGPASLRFAAPGRWNVTVGTFSVEISDDCRP